MTRRLKFMSKNFEKIKTAYDNGYYSISMLRKLVGKTQGITKKEFEQITGQKY